MAKTNIEIVHKVAMSIPTEGHTLPEAYDNHLVSAQRVGGWEAKELMENRIMALKAKYKISPKDLNGVTFHKHRYEVYWYTTGRLLTQMAREKLAEHAVKQDCDYLIMYDDDMILPRDFAQRMLRQMEKHPEIDVLGALAFMRNTPHFPVIYSVIKGFDARQGGEYYIREFVKRYPKDSLVECEAVGFGGVCIRTSLLKKMGAPYFMSTTQTGEDVWFCYRAKRDAGARVFMDTSIKMGHLKNPDVVDEEYFEKWVKENKYDLGPEVAKHIEDDK